METNKNVSQGDFFKSLKRNNREIKEDRALALGEDTELYYRRKIEDCETELKKYNRERNSLLDLSPTDANSLILVANFDAEKWVETEAALSLKIANTELKLDVLKERYSILFTGATTDLEEAA